MSKEKKVQVVTTVEGKKHSIWMTPAMYDYFISQPSLFDRLVFGKMQK